MAVPREEVRVFNSPEIVTTKVRLVRERNGGWVFRFRLTLGGVRLMDGREIHFQTVAVAVKGKQFGRKPRKKS